jgi:hypothetical protein
MLSIKRSGVDLPIEVNLPNTLFAGFAGQGVLNKDPTVWLYEARTANTCLYTTLLPEEHTCKTARHIQYPPQKYVCKYNKLAIE